MVKQATSSPVARPSNRNPGISRLDQFQPRIPIGEPAASRFADVVSSHQAIPHSQLKPLDEELHSLLKSRKASLAGVKSLIASGADVNARDADQRTAAHYVIQTLDPKIINAVLKAKGANPNAGDIRGITPGHISVLTGNEEIVKTVKTAGADLKIKNKQRQSPRDFHTRFKEDQRPARANVLLYGTDGVAETLLPREKIQYRASIAKLLPAN